VWSASAQPLPNAEDAVRAVSRPRISPILAWQAEQKRLAASEFARSSARMLALTPEGIASVNPTAAHCAVYVTHKLSPAEIARLRAAGCVIIPSLYVPPVPGRHPLAYYLAQIPYDSMNAVVAVPGVERLDSVDGARMPQLDIAAQIVRADLVHAGVGVTSRTGVGVKFAIADSGMDLTHPDLPTPVEAFDMTNGVDVATWGANVSNTVTDHGTHVVGIATGNGAASGGKYVGMAPGADLYFYKVGNDVNAVASEADTIEAICRSITVGADVLSMSIGGFSLFMDGSEPIEQAIDAATLAGVTVFVAAGNEGTNGLHDAAPAPPAGVSQNVSFFIGNTFPFTFRMRESFRLIWRDDTPGDANISMETVNVPASASPSLIQEFFDVSVRGTEVRQFALSVSVPPGGATYTMRFVNAATGGTTPTVHAFAINRVASFPNSDGSSVVLSPAIADTAIAVGAWAHRDNWVSATGQLVDKSSLITAGALAPYSSRGPRIDGVIKPDVIAPGCYTIAARDSTPGLAVKSDNIIDDDGLMLDGSGPAHYFARAGTSMATPLAAGVGALMLEANPTITPAEIRATLTDTAASALTPNAAVGFGMVDALAAVVRAQGIGRLGDVNRDGLINGADLLEVLTNWGPCPVGGAPCPEDINGDGVVGPTDLLMLLSAFG